jgi:hypothetical protein
MAFSLLSDEAADWRIQVQVLVEHSIPRMAMFNDFRYVQ